MSASIRLLAASLVLAVSASGCIGSGGATPTPPPSSSGLPEGSATPPGPSGSADVLPSGECVPSASACITPAPSGGSASPSAASASPSAAFACPPASATLPAPSNRLTGVVVTPRDGYDEVAFEFGRSAAGSGVQPTVAMAAATPPFVAGASGLPLAVDGQTFATLTFRDMVVADAAGGPTYAGPTVIRPDTSGVREIVQSEAFEGVVGWIVGAAAPGCMRLTADPGASRLLLDVRRP